MKTSTILQNVSIPSRSLLIGICLLAATIILTGCPPQHPTEQVIPDPISLQQVLARYNQNVEHVPSFRIGIAAWEVQLYDSQTGQTHHHSDLGGSIYFQPSDQTGNRPRLYLRANTGIGGDALVLGSNSSEFWLYSKVADQGWWGTYDTADAYQLPINPNSLLQSLVLARIPDNLNTSPYPVLRVEPRHNIVSYIVPGPFGLLLKREIIIDRLSDLPMAIHDYDQQGLIARQTQLAEYEALEDAYLPRSITIISPQDESFLKLQLNHYRLDDRNRDRLFTRPTNPVDNYIHITAPLEDNE